jgi:WD40 repeat protein
MSPRRYWTSLALVVLPVLVLGAADDRYGDPIPEGAKARLGTARMRNAFGTTPSAMTPDGKFLVGGAPGGGVGYYDPATGKVVRTVKIDGAFGTPVAFSADGKRAVNSGYDNALVWDTDGGKVLAKITRPMPGGDNAVSLSADGKRAAVGGNRRDKEKGTSAVVWDVDANKQVTSVAPVQNETVLVALSPDGKRLATWGYHYERDAKGLPDPATDPARQVQFWDATSGKETAKVRLTGGFNPSAVVFSPDGSLAAAAAGESAIHLFDPATGAAKGLLLGRSRQGRKLAFSPDGKTLAAGGDDGSVQRWSVPDGKRLGTTESPVPMTYGPRGIVFADNERVVTWTLRGMATIAWEAPAGKLLTPAGGHYGGVHSAAVAGGGAEIFTTSYDGVILRWNPATGQELGPLALKLPGGFGTGVATGSAVLSPDGTRAVVPDGSAGLALYDLPAGTQQYVIPGDFNRESRGVFSADGTKVVQVMTSYDAKKNPARVAVWDVVAAKKLGEVELPGTAYLSAAITPDGKTLVTGGTKSDDKGGNATFVVTGWEVAGGKKLGEYTEPGGFGSGFVAAAGDNKSAVVATPKGPVVVIDVTTGKKSRDLETGKEARGQAAAAPAISPDGKTAAVLYQSFGPTATGTAVLVDIESGKLKKTLTGLSGNPTVAVFSPDGKALVTGSADTTALVWDLTK